MLPPAQSSTCSEISFDTAKTAVQVLAKNVYSVSELAIIILARIYARGHNALTAILSPEVR